MDTGPPGRLLRIQRGERFLSWVPFCCCVKIPNKHSLWEGKTYHGLTVFVEMPALVGKTWPQRHEAGQAVRAQRGPISSLHKQEIERLGLGHITPQTYPSDALPLASLQLLKVLQLYSTQTPTGACELVGAISHSSHNTLPLLSE